VAGDPAVSQIELQLEKQPHISVATITIDGNVDGVSGGTAHHAHKFTGPHQHRVFDQAGHNLPQEKPLEWVQAILDARQLAN
jgi:pimeloyl-ACP methyl ester carboxylesterase